MKRVLTVTIESPWPRDNATFERIAIHALREAANHREEIANAGARIDAECAFADHRGDDSFRVRMVVEPVEEAAPAA